MTKPSIACGQVLPLTSFYAHPQMADGHLNRCKECQKTLSRKTRATNTEYYKGYDRARGDLPHRKLAKKAAITKFGDSSAWRAKNPEKYTAHTAVNNAIKAGLLQKQPCEVCGTSDRIHAHHDDYSQPLTVRWLCCPCHGDLHRRERNLPGLSFHMLMLIARKSNHEDYS